MPFLSIMLVVVYCTNWLKLCFISVLLILLLLVASLLPFVSWQPPTSGRGAWILTIFNLDTRKENCWAFKALVSKSAIWEFVLTCNILIYPSKTLSLTRWQSISICFVLSWNTGFVTMWRVAWLSQNKRAA